MQVSIPYKNVVNPTTPLRVGIIGLGSNWQNRFRPVLAAERARFAVRWVYDETIQRAAVEAKALGIPFVEGLVEAMNDPELDAVLLVDRQWFHLWPTEIACRLQKPVFCAPHLADDPEHIDSICRQVETAQLPIYFDRPARANPVTRRMQKLLATRLGPARLVFWHSTMEAFSLPDAVDWCLQLFSEAPTDARMDFIGAPDDPTVETVVVDIGEGRGAQITRLLQQGRLARAHVVAEHGTVDLQLPYRLSWTHRGNVCHEKCPSRTTLEQQALRQFYDMLRGNRPAPPHLEDERRTCQVMQMLSPK
jgi:hypothetical protein